MVAIAALLSHPGDALQMETSISQSTLLGVVYHVGRCLNAQDSLVMEFLGEHTLGQGANAQPT